MGEETPAGTIIRHLHELQRALEPVGFGTRMNRPTSMPPSLTVTNPAVTQMNETIRCAHHDGELWFFYSFGEPICPARDTERAAKEIGRVIAGR